LCYDFFYVEKKREKNRQLKNDAYKVFTKTGLTEAIECLDINHYLCKNIGTGRINVQEN